MMGGHPPRQRTTRPFAADQRGQAIVEFAFAFPLQLFVMFAIIQLSMLFVARQVVQVASFKAARAAMVADDALDADRRATIAAALACAPVTGTSIRGANLSAAYLAGDAVTIYVPGWGVIPKSGISRGLKTLVSDISYPAPGEIEVTVTHYYELPFPVVNRLFAWFSGHLGGPHAVEDAFGPGGTSVDAVEAAWEEATGVWQIGAPHMRLRSTTRLAVPGG